MRGHLINAILFGKPGRGRGKGSKGAEKTSRSTLHGVGDDARTESSASSASGSAGSANSTVIGTGRIVELCGSSVGIADSSVCDDMG